MGITGWLCIILTGSAAICRAEVTSADVLAKIRKEHPRVMMTPQRAGEIKTALEKDEWLQWRYKTLRKSADEVLNEPPCDYGKNGGDGILDVSRKVMERVSTLAVVYRASGEKKYAERCWKELDAAAKFPDWDPEHFLDTAEMTGAMAMGYDWLYDQWSNKQRRELREAIVEKGLKPGLAVYNSSTARAGYNWPAKVNNWNIVCNGGMAMGALALADEEPEIAGEILAKAIASLPPALKQSAPDGGWGEGPMYWEYATLYEAMCLSSLETACGTDFGLGDIGGVDQVGWFAVYVNGPAGGAFNFADAEEDEDTRAGCQMFWMARRFHEPRFAGYQEEYAGGRVKALDLVWGAGQERKSWTDRPTDRYFRGLEMATMRDGWDSPKGWFVGFKAGTNAVNHSHLDVGTFVIDAKGIRWAVQLGPDDYDLPGYFDGGKKGTRWTYYRMRAEGNNTLVINPGKGPDQAPKAAATITTFSSAPGGVELSADLTPVYSDAAHVSRAISFMRGHGATITDTIQLNSAGEVWWFMHTRAAVKVAPDGRSAELAQGGKTLTMKLLADSDGRIETTPASPLPGSPNPVGQMENRGVTRIAVHLNKAKEGKIVVGFE